MAQITLRLTANKTGPQDLTLRVSDQTHEYLLSTTTPTIRVSAYLEADVERVEKKYEEIYVNEDCQSKFYVTQVMPGSKTRKVSLPDQMKTGEQLTILVNRS